MPAPDAPESKSTPAQVITPLTRALRALDADDRQHLSASAAVEARLLAEVRALAHAKPPRRQPQWRWPFVLASAATLLIAAIGIWASWPANGVLRGTASPAGAEITTDFMPLMYGDVPATESHLVRLEVPRMALASFGVTPREVVDADAAGQKVVVDLIVGEDGLARAVRFVQAAQADGNRSN